MPPGRVRIEAPPELVEAYDEVLLERQDGFVPSVRPGEDRVVRDVPPGLYRLSLVSFVEFDDEERQEILGETVVEVIAGVEVTAAFP